MARERRQVVDFIAPAVPNHSSPPDIPSRVAPLAAPISEGLAQRAVGLQVGTNLTIPFPFPTNKNTTISTQP